MEENREKYSTAKARQISYYFVEVFGNNYAFIIALCAIPLLPINVAILFIVASFLSDRAVKLSLKPTRIPFERFLQLRKIVALDEGLIKEADRVRKWVFF